MFQSIPQTRFDAVREDDSRHLSQVLLVLEDTSAITRLTQTTNRLVRLVLVLEVVDDVLRSDRLRSLQRHAQGTVPEDLRQSTHSTGDTEEHSVVLVLLEAVVPQEDAGVGVDVRVRVLGLAVLSEDTRHDVVDGVDDLEERVVRQVLQGELALALVTRISLAQHSVTVARNDLTSLQGLPGEVSDGLLVDFLALGNELGLQGLDPAQDLLVSQTVQRTSQSVQTSREGQVRIGQGGANQVSGVGRGVTTLVIRVDDQVHAHQLVEVMGVITQHAAEAGGVIQLASGVLDDNTILELAAVDQGSNLRKLGNDVKDILQGGLPVLVLVDTSLVSLGELGLSLASHQGHGQLGHRVHALRERADEGLNVGRELGTVTKFLSQSTGLLDGRNLGGEEEPDQGLRDGLTLASRALEGGELSLELRDGVTTEADTLVGIQQGGLVVHALDVTTTTDALLNGNLTERTVAVLLLELLQSLLLSRDLILQDLLQALFIIGVNSVRKPLRKSMQMTDNNDIPWKTCCGLA